MIKQQYKDIVTPELLEGAIENNEFEGFREDYHVLHCLMRKYQPKSVFEVGTNRGRGTMIVCNAVPNAQVYSLDLPTEECHKSLQHPINEGHGDCVGSLCTLPFTQLRGDSMKFDYSQYPCEAAYVDGEHSEKNVFHESSELFALGVKLIVWHDSDIDEVWKGITRAFGSHEDNYYLYRVTNTRISYATRKMEGN